MQNTPAQYRSLFACYRSYVVKSMLAMLGMSCYILADTCFISQAEGANGITALNLVLPIYSLIFALGSLIATGCAIRCKIRMASGEKDGGAYFGGALWLSLAAGAVFVVPGLLFPEQILVLMGADAVIVSVGTAYTRIVMCFAPLFMWNYVFNAFVRNDNAPNIAMIATLVSTLFNVVFDYLLMFPLKMGMAGAALATVLSPLVGIAICMVHVASKKCTVKPVLRNPHRCKALRCLPLGVSAFVGEISSGITTTVFNFLILGLAGNVGVAAYGIIANLAVVGTALFNGVAQGAQPLLSEEFGMGNRDNTKKLLRYSLITALLLAVVLVGIMFAFGDGIIGIFNRDGDVALLQYAQVGLRIYFTGYLFAGLNIVGSSYLSSVGKTGWASAVSLLRGLVAIVICAFTLAALFGMTGVWSAFPAAEGCAFAVLVAALLRTREKGKRKTLVKLSSVR